METIQKLYTQRQVYTDRYANISKTPAQGIPEITREYVMDEADLSEGFDSFSEGGGEFGLRDMENGRHSGVSVSDTELLHQMAEEIADLKEQLANHKSAGPETGDAEFETEAETEAEEAPQSDLLVYLQEKGQTGLDEKRLQKLLKENGLSETGLRGLTLPLDADAETKLYNFFQEVDPEFKKQLQADAGNPYRAGVVQRLCGLLAAAVPAAATNPEAAATALLDRNFSVTWDGEKIKSEMTGVVDYAEGAEVNGRWVHCKKFMDEYLTPLAAGTKSVDDLRNYFAQGNNGVDHGGQNRAIEIRRVISAIYFAADKNPYLVRRYLKKLPESALRLMKDYLAMDPTRKDVGDAWDGNGAMKVLDWVMSGGSIPAELGGTLNPTA
ncbi:MAG: hypothetical protein U1F66_00910 [bacterium]